MTKILYFTSHTVTPSQVLLMIFYSTTTTDAGNQEQVILDYFETNYIGELRRGRRLPPRFPHAMWSMNLRVQNDLPRSSCSCLKIL